MRCGPRVGCEAYKEVAICQIATEANSASPRLSRYGLIVRASYTTQHLFQAVVLTRLDISPRPVLHVLARFWATAGDFGLHPHPVTPTPLSRHSDCCAHPSSPAGCNLRPEGCSATWHPTQAGGRGPGTARGQQREHAPTSPARGVRHLRAPGGRRGRPGPCGAGGSKARGAVERRAHQRSSCVALDMDWSWRGSATEGCGCGRRPVPCAVLWHPRRRGGGWRDPAPRGHPVLLEQVPTSQSPCFATP